MHVLTVVGARPQFIKAAPLSRVLRGPHRETLVHTGQHYDPEMSDVFFEELALPAPDYHLGVGSASHAAQTAKMLVALEDTMRAVRPDAVLVYGDTNSTLAGALAAAKLGLPVAHVEAGLRSYNRAMPEEINRVVADCPSRWLFVPSALASRQLAAEGITHGVHEVGDIMYDAVRQHVKRARTVSGFPAAAGVGDGGYYLCTVHRAENTDHPDRLGDILRALEDLDRPVLFPVHPRTRARLPDAAGALKGRIRVMPPVGYLDMLRLVAGAACVLTDSGGVQKEAYYLETPCVTMRSETEWTETVAAGWNIVAGTDPERIVDAVSRLREPPAEHPLLYGGGDTADRIVSILSTSAV